jgi:hypothetical protein
VGGEKMKGCARIGPTSIRLCKKKNVALEWEGTKVGMKYEKMIRSAGIAGTRVKVRREPRFSPGGGGD